MFNIEDFISKHITQRNQSLFNADLLAHATQLEKEISGKKVLVIGGGGTIGSSFVRALLPYKPATLVVVDLSENYLTELTRTVRSTEGLYVPEDYKTYPISYSDPIFERIFLEYKGFDIVANFSAHKHVRSERDRYSIEALLENNVLRAKGLLDLLAVYPPSHFFCVSTDKAANPVNIMGCSKKIMEELIMGYGDFFKVSTARFANVAFSNGSLLYGFIERMMKNQPISAPTDVRRYFVSPDESGQICLMACVLGKNREIFFPKLDESQMMTFSSIAEDFLAYLGYKPYYCKTEEEARSYAATMKAGDKSYPVYFFQSDTTGEKSFEEFFVQGEQIDLDRFSSLGVITDYSPRDFKEIMSFLNSLEYLLKRNDITKGDIVDLMKSFVPNFSHEEKGKNLDQKM